MTAKNFIVSDARDKKDKNKQPVSSHTTSSGTFNKTTSSGKFGNVKPNFREQISGAVDSVIDLFKGGYEKVSNGAKALAGAVDDLISPASGSTAKPIVYSDWSPAAQQFGMDQQTAYAEHMANTAHQREVADLRAAGLNPVLGVGSGASGVSGHVATSGSSAQKSLNGDFIVDAIGATAAVVTAILTKNPAYGYMAGNAVNAVGDMITGSKK